MNKLFIGGPLDGQIVDVPAEAADVFAPVPQDGDGPFTTSVDELVWHYRPCNYAWNKPRGAGLPDEGPRMLALMTGSPSNVTTDQVMTALARVAGLLVLDHRDTWNNSAALDVEICGAR